MNVPSRHAVQGFSLIEVLIAMLILAVGILGAGAMQMVGLQANQGAYYRSQAVFLASDMLDRMRGNRQALASYVGIDTEAIGVAATPACLTATGGCTPVEMANADGLEWNSYFEVQNILPNGIGRVAQVGGLYQITITWNERDWNGGGGARAVAAQTYTISANLED